MDSLGGNDIGIIGLDGGVAAFSTFVSVLFFLGDSTSSG
jgi:hypothetical protein